MRFCFRKIETLADRVGNKNKPTESSRSQKSSNSQLSGNSGELDQVAGGGKTINSSKKPKTWELPKNFLDRHPVLHVVFLMSVLLICPCMVLWCLMQTKQSKISEKVRVTVHEEPIEKHVWLDQNLIEIKPD